MAGQPQEIVRQNQTFEQRRELQRQGYRMVQKSGDEEVYRRYQTSGRRAN